MASVICIVAGYAAVAASTQLRPPTVVVTFDIEQVIADLTERADAETKLHSLIMDIEDSGKAKFEAVAQLEEELDATSDLDRPIVNEELDKLKLEALSYQRFAAAQVDIERSLMYRDLYQKIQTSVQKIAEQNGYDLVLINDVHREILVNPNAKVSREFQVREQLQVKRIVFSSNQIDITEQIVSHMNLEWEKDPGN
ncbi:MAG: OmpH family outer membrane protein [Planctomycetes bacterium]|nr:OmpH family outer membrane protein [Planctomycetota bacterium]